MRAFIVHLSDAGNRDRQIAVEVSDTESLAQVAHVAIEEFEASEGGDVQFPLFLDIHPAEDFANVQWMNGRHSNRRDQ